MEHLFKKIPQKKVSDKVFGQIRELIASGKLRPGEQLPPERELTRLFTVSRSSVREAILRLECLGFLEQRHGEGTFVKSVAEDVLPAAMGSFLAQGRFIADLFEIRRLLEVWAVACAARRATETEIQEMRDCLSQERGASGRRHPLSLHILIASATHNMVLIHMMDPLFDWIRQATKSAHSMPSDEEDVRQTLMAQHNRIVEAIENRDPRAASAFMEAHLAYVADRVLGADAGNGRV